MKSRLFLIFGVKIVCLFTRVFVGFREMLDRRVKMEQMEHQEKGSEFILIIIIIIIIIIIMIIFNYYVTSFLLLLFTSF